MYNEVRLKEIIILDNVWNNVELFSENDDRCVYEFIKQVDPLKALMETEAYTSPENQLESLLSHPKILNRVLMTLQTQDIESFRVFPGGNLRLSGRRSTETLAGFRRFLDETARDIVDSGPPAPLFFHYYGIQQLRVCAEEEDHWWDPEISYPCGLPGHVHELAFCQEFWTGTRSYCLVHCASTAWGL